MFRKPKKKEHLRKKASEEEETQEDGVAQEQEEREEFESRIQNILEAQRVRQRRSGMDAVECAVGKELAKEFHRLDEDPFRMRGGGMLQLTDHQKAALNAADIEADIKEQFKKETLLRDENEEMRRYVESRLKREHPEVADEDEGEEGSGGASNGEAGAKRPKFVSPEDEILFKAADRVKKYTSKRNEELLSNQMLVGIPEVDLGIETRMKNIEETEQKKMTLLRRGMLPKQIAEGWQSVLDQPEEEGKGKKRGRGGGGAGGGQQRK